MTAFQCAGTLRLHGVEAGGRRKGEPGNSGVLPYKLCGARRGVACGFSLACNSAVRSPE